ncbi:MAG TPA: metalloregulator ArsR/SmtB family transcription factor [Dermatophilaceae bacterium]|nr:metalloregulator ArsR/SmtB family transcription factor [Dermatophilaceae bacterium]
MTLPLATVPPTADEASCCVALTGGALEPGEAQRLARSFKALSDPNRVRLLSLIAASETGEACVCDLTDVLGLSQPTVSHHMRQLVQAGLVTRDQRGRWAHYAVVPDALEALSRALAAARAG